MFSSIRIVFRNAQVSKPRYFSQSLARFNTKKNSESWISDSSSGSVARKTLNRVKETEQSQTPIDIDNRLARSMDTGTTYDPFDFSMAKRHLENKLRMKRKPVDLFSKRNIDPLDLYVFPNCLNQFLSSTGRILPRESTGLSPHNHRRLAKAIKRARAIGLLSNVSRSVEELPGRNF